jgi:hypothetical protein
MTLADDKLDLLLELERNQSVTRAELDAMRAAAMRLARLARTPGLTLDQQALLRQRSAAIRSCFEILEACP